MTHLEKRIKEKAEKRFDAEYEKAIKLLNSNEILKKIKIGNFNLTSEYGHCPATDLFVREKTLLIKETNFAKVKETLINKYEKEETDGLLDKISMLSEFFNENK